MCRSVNILGGAGHDGEWCGGCGYEVVRSDYVSVDGLCLIDESQWNSASPLYTLWTAWPSKQDIGRKHELGDE